MSTESGFMNSTDESPTAHFEDLLTSSLPARTGPYRSISAKRPRDPSHRKSVSFNDVPIVHEVPLHDFMRSTNSMTYRSWMNADASASTTTTTTSASSVLATCFPSQILTPLKVNNPVVVPKPYANRLSSSLYSTLTTNATSNRMPDWAARARAMKATSSTDETSPRSEQSTIPLTPTIVVETPDDKAHRETVAKASPTPTYSHSYLSTSPSSPMTLSPTSNADKLDETKKHPYRSAVVPDGEYHRSLPFTFEPMSDSSATYTSMLSTNLINPNHSSNDQASTLHARSVRIRSATLPLTLNNASNRVTETISITPFRANATALLSNGTANTSRTILRPSTIAFQCTQPTAASASSTSSTNTSTTTTNANNSNTVSTTAMTTATTYLAKSSIAPARFASSAAAAAVAHSRFIPTANRPVPTSPLMSSTIKYTFAQPTLESSPTASKSPLAAYSRSRSASAITGRRRASLSASSNAGQSPSVKPSLTTGGSLYGTAKRSPNVRQTYGSYYMHRVLLPTSIN